MSEVDGQFLIEFIAFHRLEVLVPLFTLIWVIFRLWPASAGAPYKRAPIRCAFGFAVILGMLLFPRGVLAASVFGSDAAPPFPPRSIDVIGHLIAFPFYALAALVSLASVAWFPNRGRWIVPLFVLFAAIANELWLYLMFSD